eukprot:gb/GECG01011255.1/.p1 GENE.gb/GECG01011255.1/~~gb/GECG01011255.1/.p1  ORF type:complete len:268 (+),score=18.04 gb/GECG01011255.1/:1-804(+)
MYNLSVFIHSKMSSVVISRIGLRVGATGQRQWRAFSSRTPSHVIRQQRDHAIHSPLVSNQSSSSSRRSWDPYPHYQPENYAYVQIKGTSPKALSVDVLRILQQAGIEASTDDLAVWFQDVRKLVWYAKIQPTDLQKATAFLQQTVHTRVINIEPASHRDFQTARQSVALRVGEPSVILRSLPPGATERDVRLFLENYELSRESTTSEERGLKPITLYNVPDSREVFAVVRVDSTGEAHRIVRDKSFGFMSVGEVSSEYRHVEAFLGP